MFLKDMYNQLISYTKDSEGKDITIPELQNLPYWRCVWGWWMSKAYYQLDRFYQRLEDVPAGLERYSVMDEVLTQYWVERGKMRSQVTTKADCKSFYGNEV